MIKKLLALFLCTSFIISCSKASKDIAAKYVSPELYSDYNCDQVRKDMKRVSGRVSELTGNLDSNKSKDNMTTTAGIILFWPALFFIGGTKEQLLKFDKKLLFDVSSYSSFVKSFKYVIDNYAKIIQKSRNFVNKNFSSEIMCKKTLEVYLRNFN